MAEDKKDLDMEMFGDVPIIDMTEDSEVIFRPEGEEEIKEDPKEDPKEEIKEEEKTVTNEDPEDPEVVVGEQNKDGAGDSTDDNTDDVDESSPNLFSSLTTLLVEKGLISPDESTVEDEDSFVDLFKKEIEKNEYSDLTDNQKEYLRNLRDGIPEEDVKQHIKTVDQLDGITEEILEENAELRQRIIYNDFINRGYTEEKALKYLKRSIELEADKEDAKESLESIKEHNKRTFDEKANQVKQEKLLQEQNEQKRLDVLKNRVKTTKEIIEGFPITDNIREQVENNMFKVVGQDPNGVDENSILKYVRENKEDFEVKLGYLFTITKGFQDFSIIEKTKNTKVVKDLERAMKSNTRIKDSGEPAFMQDSESYSIDIGGHDLVVD